MRRLLQQKWFYVVLILLGVLAAAYWWQGNTSSHQERSGGSSHPKLQVVTSGYVPYTLTKEIAGDLVDIQMLVPPGTEPHSFEPTPGAIIAVDKADIFLYSSLQLEPWVKDLLAGLPKARSIETSPVLPGEDPHVWMTPIGALSIAKNIEKALAKADPSHKSVYKENLKQFEKEMQQLHKDFDEGLKTCQSYNLIHIGHLAFKALAETYDLNLQALSNTSHQSEHSVYKITGLIRFVKGRKVAAVFTEEMVSPDLARMVAQETKVKILPLYTIEEVSKADFEQGVRYTDYMRRNLHNLQEGLQCQAS